MHFNLLCIHKLLTVDLWMVWKAVELLIGHTNFLVDNLVHTVDNLVCNCFHSDISHNQFEIKIHILKVLPGELLR